MNTEEKTIKINQEIRNIKVIKHRVAFIYSKSQEAIDSDRILIDLYKEIWGMDKFNEASIMRTGRGLRKNHSDLYERSPEAQELSDIKSEAFKIYYGKNKPKVEHKPDTFDLKETYRGYLE